MFLHINNSTSYNSASLSSGLPLKPTGCKHNARTSKAQPIYQVSAVRMYLQNL